MPARKEDAGGAAVLPREGLAGHPEGDETVGASGGQGNHVGVPVHGLRDQPRVRARIGRRGVGNAGPVEEVGQG